MLAILVFPEHELFPFLSIVREIDMLACRKGQCPESLLKPLLKRGLNVSHQKGYNVKQVYHERTKEGEGEEKGLGKEGAPL